MVAYVNKDHEYIREYLCQVTQFLEYIEDATISPEHTDFDVILDKVKQLRAYAPFIETMIGVRRKEPHESRPYYSESQALSSTQGPGRHAQAGYQREPRTTGTTRRSSGQTRRSRG